MLELLNGLSMDLVTSLCDYSSKQDIKQKNMKYKRLQLSLPSSKQDIKQKNMKYKRLQLSLPSITLGQYGWILAKLLQINTRKTK